MKAALAHELGHANFDVPKDHPDYLPPGAVDDEARASAWAAVHVENLSPEDRMSLIRDARERNGVIPDGLQDKISEIEREAWRESMERNQQ